MKAKVTDIQQKEKNFFFQVEGDKRSFSGYGRCEFKVGDTIDFEVVPKTVGDKVYYNTKFSESEGKPVKFSDEHIDEVTDFATEVWDSLTIQIMKKGIECTDQQRTTMYIQSCNIIQKVSA